MRTGGGTIGQAQVQGASLHSSDLVFEPGEVSPGKYHFAIGTAGATSLVLHTVYLPLAWRSSAPSEVILTGGTHVNKSPCFHFLETTWRQYLELLGLRIGLHMRRQALTARWRRRGGEAFQPCAGLRGLQLQACDEVTEITGISVVAGLPEQIAERQAGRRPIRLRERRLRADVPVRPGRMVPGTVLTLVLDTRPVPTLFFGLGARASRRNGSRMRRWNRRFAYLNTDPSAVDAHSADQLVLPLALVDGPSRFRVAEVTPHLLTNIAVIRRFVDRDIHCDGQKGESGVVEIASGG